MNIKLKIIELLDKINVDFVLEREFNDEDGSCVYNLRFNKTPYKIYYFFNVLLNTNYKYVDYENKSATFAYCFENTVLYVDCFNIDFNKKENV